MCGVVATPGVPPMPFTVLAAAAPEACDGAAAEPPGVPPPIAREFLAASLRFERRFFGEVALLWSVLSR
uniref:Putative secreted peptide n=1 Tax=Anopheles braziliensis TaxID=58242 RepID=A0A2M3ZVN3_9DIPT